MIKQASNTKKILIMRHGTSPSASGIRDFQRPLSEQGLEESKDIGKLCKHKQFIPDHILCSDAQRTQQTLSAFNQGLSTDKTISTTLSNQIYIGSVGDYLYLLQSLPSHVNTVLLIGHNPIIPSLIGTLSEPNTSDEDTYRQLMGPYYPATLAVCETNKQLDSWENLSPRGCALKNIYLPKHAA